MKRHLRFSRTGKRRRPHQKLLRAESLEPRLLLAGDLPTSSDLLDPGLGDDPSVPALVPAPTGAEGEHVADADLVAFAKALDAAGVTMYGAAWCPACTAQKKLFEDGADFLPFVEVTNPDRTLNQIGIDNNITSFPTWDFPDGTRLVGVQTLDTLAQAAGISIPTGTDPFIAPIADQTLLDDSPLHIALDGYDPNGGPLTYTVTSSDPSLVEPVVLSGNRSLRISTLSYGDMVFQLFEQRAPRPTSRVIQLAQSGFYDGIEFHRVIDNFVAQFGDPTGTGAGGSTLGDFDDQFHVELQHNQPGVLSYAKAGDDTNDSQLFITDVATRFLDGNHSVIGQLVEGEKNRDALTATATTTGDRPQFAITIDSATVFNDTENGMVMLRVPASATNLTLPASADITVTVSDQDGNSSTETFTVTVQPDPFNTGPWLEDIAPVRTTTNTPAQFQLSAVDVEGDPVTFSGVQQGSVPYTFTVDGTTGDVTVTPPTDFVGTMDLLVRVTATSGSNTSDPFDSQLVSIEVAPQPGTGVDLQAGSDTGISSADDITSASTLLFDVTGVTDGALVQLFTGNTLLGTATASGDTATVSTTALTALGDGTYEVYATQTVSGVESDPFGNFNVTIDTTAPAAFNSTPPATATTGTELSYDADHDEEGSSGFTYALQGAPSGAVLDSQTGVFTWTPTSAQVGTHNFSIIARDAAGNETAQNVSIEVSAPQIDERVIVRLSVTDAGGNPVTTLNEGDTFTLNAFVRDAADAGVFAIYFDVEFAADKATVTGPLTFGSNFTNVTSGDTSTPGLIDEAGATTSQFTATGGGEFLLFSAPMQATGTGTITFTTNPPDNLPFHDILVFDQTDPLDPVNDVSYGTASVTIAPAFGTSPDIFNVDEDTQDNVLDVLANDAFLPGKSGTLTIASVSGPSEGGTATVSTDGSTILYSPPADFFGQETFTYVATDGSAQLQGQVTVQVHPINDPPTANDDAVTVVEDSTDNLLDVLANDLFLPDVGETLTITSVSASQQGGTVTIGPAQNHILYSPPANFFGQDTFTYTIDDGNGGTDTATVTVDVTEFNDPPVARNDTATVDEDSTDNRFSVLDNDDTGVDTNETLSLVRIVSVSGNGTASVDGSDVVYTPAADFFGTETIRYEISDGNGGTAQADVVVTVNNVNDDPTAVDDAIDVVGDVADQTLDVLANDSDAPDNGEDLVITDVVASGSGATATIAADGKSILYTPPAGFTGQDMLTYTISDGNGGTATANVTVNVLDFSPGSISGTVYFDVDDDGLLDPEESRIGGVTITLIGTDFRGTPVELTAETDAAGNYSFTDVVPGDYRLIEESLPFVIDGRETPGTAGGDTSINDEIAVTLPDGAVLTGYLFAERGRTADAIRPMEFLASSVGRRTGDSSNWLVAATDTGTEGQGGANGNGTPAPANDVVWFSLGGNWDAIEQVSVGFDTTQLSVELVTTDGSGAQQQITLPDVEQVLPLDDDPTAQVALFSIFGLEDLTFAPPTAPPAGGEGEGEGEGFFATPAAPTPGVDTWMTQIGEGEAPDAPAVDAAAGLLDGAAGSDTYADTVDQLLGSDQWLPF